MTKIIVIFFSCRCYFFLKLNYARKWLWESHFEKDQSRGSLFHVLFSNFPRRRYTVRARSCVRSSAHFSYVEVRSGKGPLAHIHRQYLLSKKCFTGRAYALRISRERAYPLPSVQRSKKKASERGGGTKEPLLNSILPQKPLNVNPNPSDPKDEIWASL